MKLLVRDDQTISHPAQLSVKIALLCSKLSNIFTIANITSLSPRQNKIHVILFPSIIRIQFRLTLKNSHTCMLIGNARVDKIYLSRININQAK